MAINSSPGRTERESIETPASRATGSSPAPVRANKTLATCAIVHRINASESSPYGHTPGFAVCSPVAGLLLYQLTLAYPGHSGTPAPESHKQECALGAKLRARVSVARTGRIKAALAQRLLRYPAIIPGKRLVGEHLIVLMSLACE